MASANVGNLPKKLADAYFTGTFKFLMVSSLPSGDDRTRSIFAMT